eukprot:01372.XXX_2561_3031_1 [CDS] Oithona nana genome sequencing.
MAMKTALAVMASLSIALQLIVGILIILDHRIKVETKDDLKTVSKYNTINHILMFCIVVLNIVASGLGVA